MTDNKLPANWTTEKLAALKPKTRFSLLESVKTTKMGSQQDRERMIEAIIESGPIIDQTAMKSDNPMLYTNWL
jgi:hypothetical protein